MPHEVDAEATNRTLFGGCARVGRRLVKGVEFVAVVLDFNVQRLIIEPQADMNVVRGIVVISIFDDVGDKLLDAEVRGEDRFGICATGFEKHRDRFGHPGQFVKGVPKTESKIGNRHANLC